MDGIIRKDKMVNQVDEHGWRLFKVLADLNGQFMGDFIKTLCITYAEKHGLHELVEKLKVDKK